MTATTPATIYALALQAADRAYDSARPTPMIVGTPTTPLGNDIDHSQKTYYVSDGPCGFAWVNIRPARGALVAWMKKQGIGRSDKYRGGYTVWMPTTRRSQSLERNAAAAYAFAGVLAEHGVTAYAESRID